MQEAHLLKDLCVSKVIPVADADVMLGSCQMVQEAAWGHAPFKPSSWRSAVAGGHLLPDLAQQLRAYISQLPPGVHDLQRGTLVSAAAWGSCDMHVLSCMSIKDLASPHGHNRTCFVMTHSKFWLQV